MHRILTFLVLHILFIACASAQGISWDWSFAYGGSHYDYCYDMDFDSDNNVYTVGYCRGIVDFDPGPGTAIINTSGAQRIYLAKYDANGAYVWAKSLEAPNVYHTGSGVAVDDDDNVLICGSFEGTLDADPDTSTFYLTNNGNNDFFLAKYDSGGNLLWAKSAGGPDIETGGKVVVESGTNAPFYHAGVFNGTADMDPGQGVTTLVTNGASDIFISKYDGNGSQIWVKSFGGAGVDHLRHIELDHEDADGIYISGYFEGTSDFDPDPNEVYNMTSAGGDDAFIMRLDSSGNLLWARQFGGTGWDQGLAITILQPSGDIVFGGAFQNTIDLDPNAGSVLHSSAGDFDMFIVRLDHNGNYIWSKTMGGTSHEKLWTLTAGPGGGYIYAAGYFSGTTDLDPDPNNELTVSSVDNDDTFILRLDQNGNLVDYSTHGGWGPDIGLVLGTDNMGDSYLSSSFFGSSVSYGPFTLTNANPTNTRPDVGLSKIGSNTTSISEPGDDDLRVYPVPATNSISIEGMDSRELKHIEIIDMQGRLQRTSTFTSPIDISDLAPGSYRLRVVYRNGASSWIPFLKS